MKYSYHNRIKQRIRNGEMTGHEYVEQYNKITPCLLLYFSTDPFIRPIRDYRFEEYESFLKTAPHLIGTASNRTGGHGKGVTT